MMAGDGPAAISALLSVSPHRRSLSSRVGNLGPAPETRPGLGPAEGSGSRCGQVGKRDDGCLWDCSGWQIMYVCVYVIM